MRGAYLTKVTLGEDQANIAHQSIQQGSPGVTSGALIVESDAALHQSVLAHQHCAVGPQTLLHKLGP